MDCGPDYDDPVGIHELEHAAADAQVFPLEKRRNLPDEGQGEVRLHGYALRPGSGRENIRSGRRAREDAGHSGAEIRPDDEKHRQPLAARPQPQDHDDGLRRENQPEREGKRGRQGEPEPELQHRRHLQFRHAEPETEIRRQGRRNHQAGGGRKRVVPVEFEPCARCQQPVWTAHRLAVWQTLAPDRGFAEKIGLEERFVAWRRAAHAL